MQQFYKYLYMPYSYLKVIGYLLYTRRLHRLVRAFSGGMSCTGIQ